MINIMRMMMIGRLQGDKGFRIMNIDTYEVGDYSKEQVIAVLNSSDGENILNLQYVEGEVQRTQGSLHDYSIIGENNINVVIDEVNEDIITHEIKYYVTDVNGNVRYVDGKELYEIRHGNKIANYDIEEGMREYNVVQRGWRKDGNIGKIELRCGGEPNNSIINDIKTGDIEIGTFIIPRVYMNRCITALGNESMSYKRVSNVIASGSVARIAREAFRKCVTLRTVDLRNSMIADIPVSAFYGCRGLERVELPETVTSIGASAFGECKSLRSIRGGKIKVDSYAFSGCAALKGIGFKIIGTIGNYTFSTCESLEDIDLSQVDRIEQASFWGCKKLKRAKVPKESRVYWSSAFLDCREIDKVVIEEGVEVIPEKAFMNCINAVVYIPSTVRSIRNEALENIKYAVVEKGSIAEYMCRFRGAKMRYRGRENEEVHIEQDEFIIRAVKRANTLGKPVDDIITSISNEAVEHGRVKHAVDTDKVVDILQSIAIDGIVESEVSKDLGTYEDVNVWGEIMMCEGDVTYRGEEYHEIEMKRKHRGMCRIYIPYSISIDAWGSKEICNRKRLLSLIRKGDISDDTECTIAGMKIMSETVSEALVAMGRCAVEIMNRDTDVTYNILGVEKEVIAVGNLDLYEQIMLGRIGYDEFIKDAKRYICECTMDDIIKEWK